MNTQLLIEDAERTLKSVNERFGWQGDEEDQAWDLLMHILGRDPDWEEDLPIDIAYRFDELVKRRTTGEPMAYILGWVDFLDFKMDIKPGAFIPRLTSEFLCRQAVKKIKGRSSPVHVDVACGIGPVSIGSARRVPHGRVYGLDISQDAVKQAASNAKKLRAPNAQFIKSDMFGSLPKDLKGKVDVITIHPPYVPHGEIDDLPEEIKNFEPEHTLTDKSGDGLYLSRRVIAEGKDWLNEKGWVMIEIVPTESQRVRKLFRDHGYRDIQSTHGKLKLTRVIIGKRP